MTTAMPGLVDHARGAGPLARGRFRVVVVESDDRLTTRDFSDLDEARRYADDAASEADDLPPVAVVVDARFCVVHCGRPYTA